MAGQRKIPLLSPEFVGDNVKWARGEIPGQGESRVQKHTLLSVKTGLSPDKCIFLILIMKIQSHRKTVTKNAFFYTVCHKNEKLYLPKKG